MKNKTHKSTEKVRAGSSACLETTASLPESSASAVHLFSTFASVYNKPRNILGSKKGEKIRKVSPTAEEKGRRRPMNEITEVL